MPEAAIAARLSSGSPPRASCPCSPSRARAVSSARPLWPCQTLAEHSGSPTPTLLDGQHGLGGVQRPAEARGPAGWGVLWGHCGPSAAFARGSSNLTEQLWEADGDIYRLSWLIICPARPPGELFGGSDELGEAVLDC